MSEQPSVSHAPNPIPFLLADFKRATATDTMLTDRQQRKLILDMQHDDTESSQNALIDNHLGLIAAVTYDFMDSGTDSHELILTGSEALLELARSHNIQRSSQGKYSFSDRAVVAIRQALSADYGEPLAPTLSNTPNGLPMERVFHFMADLKIDKPNAWHQQVASDRQKGREELKEQLDPGEYKILSVLHLPDRQAAEQTDIKIWTLRGLRHTAMEKLGAETRTDLALKVLEQGIDFDVPRPPLGTRFTARERQVAGLLHLKQPALATELGLSEKQVGDDISSLLQKTGARTRTELALIARIHPLKLVRAEARPIPEVLQVFTPMQREALKRLNLPFDTIAEQIGVRLDSLSSILKRARKTADCETNTELVLKLHRGGLQYDIPKPEQPLVKLMDSTQMQIASSLHLSNEAIANLTGLNAQRVKYLIWKMRKDTGARSRQEMALVMETYDTGERRDPEPTRLEKLAARLGLETLKNCDIDVLLAPATAIERQAIRDYYLSEKPMSWYALAEQGGIAESTLRDAAKRGIQRIRRIGIKLVATVEAASSEVEPQDEPLSQAA